MAFSLNKVMLIGNLGRDAETRFTTNNLSVTNFSIATTRSFKDKEGNWQNETTWHNLTGFNLSDYYKDNLKKGKKFYIEGRISKRDYNDKDGNKRTSTDVIVERLIPLEAKSGDSAGTAEVTESYSSEPPQVENNDDLPF
ncbi:MAG: single-stranded DNA-binding protein [Bacteroidetes bacterium]|nr:single-stranded DNA-binding protein [Bacteroidota bacterium]MCH8033869.1 single-stranded DNA-binding protein [Bacteroidota bacterium]